MKHFVVTLLLAVCVSGNAAADWDLVNESSSLSFVSIKNGAVVETHAFHVLSGRVRESGDATFVVTLDGVDTLIPIRDERMEKMLFEISKYPVATFNTKVDLNDAKSLRAGEALTLELAGELDLHGVASRIKVPVRVTRAGRGIFVVSTIKPILIDSSRYQLGAGIEALRQVAGLDAITRTIPVSFTLTFKES